MNAMFHKAERKKAKLRLALTGPSGSGKTWGALMVAKGLGGKIALADTERGSASLYSHLTAFDVAELQPPYSPEKYIETIKGAERAGYDILIIDSITPEWSGRGGCLELADQIAQSKFKGNTWSAWSVVNPRHQAFIDAIIQSPMHLIVTMRSKTETAQIEDGGRKKVVKLGMANEQRNGIEYEFTTVLDLTHEGHYALASKDRTGLFNGDPVILSPDTGERLREWLESGAEPLPDTSIKTPAEEPAPSSSQAKQDKTWQTVQAKFAEATHLADLGYRYDYFRDRVPTGWRDNLDELYEIRRNEILEAAHEADAPTFDEEEVEAR